MGILKRLFSRAFIRGEWVVTDDGKPATVTHFSGDEEDGERYSNGGDGDIWVQYSDGTGEWRSPDELRRSRP